MAKLKKANVRHLICNTCNGNGYVKIKIYTGQRKVFQCWNCNSEGEYYETVENNNVVADNISHDKLH